MKLILFNVIIITLTLSSYFPFVISNAPTDNRPVEKVTPIDDTEGDLVPNKDVNSVSGLMKSLDETLTKMNTDPPVDGGQELMKLLRTYNQAAYHLLNHCTSDKLKAFTVAKDLLERGGPEFLDVDIDEGKMEHRFQWDSEAMNEMHDARKRTNIIWYDLWRLYNKIPIT